MHKACKVLGIIGMSLLLTSSLSGCIPKPLPDEERYQYIDNVLEVIDYKTVGDIVEEEIDDGDGILSPSYKIVSYGSEGSFKELEKRLKYKNSNCVEIKNAGQINCSFHHASVSVFYIKKDDSVSNTESYIYITDGSSGRGN